MNGFSLFALEFILIKLLFVYKEINEKFLEELGYELSKYLDLSGFDYDSIDDWTFKAFFNVEIIH